MYFESLCECYKELPEVKAIALGGSRAGEQYDERSDYDLYIYCTSVPKESVRREILKKCCSYTELSNSFWELEDDCTLKDGIDIDILYRNPDAFADEISSVVDGAVAYNGYTTCMWHNLLNSRIIYDEGGWYESQQKKYRIPYPQQLKKNIIEKNMRLLTGNLPSYDTQILKAVSRNDLTSVNHRTAAYMESYFDIIFAMNEMTHPGEKRMLSIAAEQAKLLPKDFEKNVTSLYRDLFHNKDNIKEDIRLLTENLQQCLQ